MNFHTLCMAAFLATSAAQAQGTVQISIGVRETGFGGSAIGTIGANGGTVGGIEWINRDAQTLVLDGSWQQFTFTVATDPVLGFAGTSANGVLEGSYGVLEHIRVLNGAGVTAPIVLLLDDVTDTTATLGAQNFGDFQGYPAGALAMFRNAGFSGSTSTNVLAGSTTAVQNTFPSGSASLRFDFQFVDGTPTRWVRLTSFNLANQPNPVVRFDDQSVVTFRLLGFVESQPSLGYQGPGTVDAALCGFGLNAGEASSLLAAGAPGNAFGAVCVSFPGFPDLPIVGGTIASGTGLLLTIPLVADAAGQARLPLAGDPTLVDFVMQAVFLDFGLPQSVAFAPAFLARFGQ